MTRTERWQYFGIWLFLGFVPLLMRSLWQPDEGRYAEIPREMLASGDWLTPRLNYVLYFEKPPFQYWLSAISMKVFGVNAAAARLPLALAAAISLWCAWKLAKRLGAEKPMAAAFMAATALLAYGCGQILTLDALFSAFMVLTLTATIEAIAARYRERPALGWTLVAFGSLGLAVLTKGVVAPVLLGGTLICSLPWVWKEPRLRRALLRTFFHPLGWILLLVVSVPWFVAVDKANPGHAQFFFIHEHFKRFTTHEHSRQGSKNPVLDKLYFIAILIPGLLPWLSTSLDGLKRSLGFLRQGSGPRAEEAPLHRWVVSMLLMGIVVPLVFFSLSGSKLVPYILPVIVPVVALAAGFAKTPKVWSAWVGREILILGAVILLAGLLPGQLIRDRSHVEGLVILGLAYAALGFWATRPRGLNPARLMACLAVLCIGFTWAANRSFGASKDLSRLVRMAPAEAQWISAGNYYQVLPFISQSPVTVVAGTGELAYGMNHLPSAERDRRFYTEPRELNAAALRMRSEQPRRPVWVLATPDAWKALPEEERIAWERVGQAPSAMLLRLRP